MVPDARVIPQLHLREAAELAYYGAKVLHPRALIPLVGAPTSRCSCGRSPTRDAAGHRDLGAARTLDKYPVKALSAAPAQALITVGGNGMLGVPGIAARTFEALHREAISVSLISQSSSEQSICFSVPRERRHARRADACSRSSATRSRASEIDGIEVETGLATVAVVGLGMARHASASPSRVFTALARRGHQHRRHRPGLVGAEHLVRRRRQGRRRPRSARVHAAFQLAKIGGGAATRAAHRDVVLLGFGQIGRALAGIIDAQAPKKTARTAPQAAPGRPPSTPAASSSSPAA